MSRSPRTPSKTTDPPVDAQAPTARQWPVVTLTVIAVDLAVAAMTLFNQGAVDAMAFYRDRPVVWQALTSLFVHANTLHLLGNLVFLAAVGPLVELSKGPWRLLLVFLVSGQVGVLAFSVFGKGTSLVGASGAIAGCVGYASVASMQKRVALAPGLAAPVWVVVLVWVAAQAAGAMLVIGDTGVGVSYAAHLGGFLGGLVCAAAYRVWRDHDVRLGHEVLDRLNSQGPAAALAAAKSHLAKHPDDAVAHRQAATALADLGRGDQAVRQWWELAWSNPGHAAEAVREIKKSGGFAQETSNRRLRMAESLRETDPVASLDLIRSVAEGAGDDPEKANAMLALALQTDDADEAKTFAGRLEAEYALHPAAETARQLGLPR